MKKRWWALALCAALLLMLCGAAEADYTYGDWLFIANDNGGVTITKCAWDSYSDQDVTIPGTLGGKEVTAIGEKVFESSEITGVTIPASVTEIGEKAFNYCPKMKTVTFESGSKLDRIGAEAFSNSGILSISIPASVTCIGEKAFYNCSLAAVTFPEGSKLDSIGAYTFYYCNISSITIPASVTGIGNNAFDSCYHLSTLSFEVGSKLTRIGTEAFSDDPGIKSITIPASVTDIGNNAFDGCDLSNVTIQSPVITIGDWAFKDSLKLNSKTIRQNQVAGAHGKTSLTVNWNGEATVNVMEDSGYVLNKLSYTPDNGSETVIEKNGDNKYLFPVPDTGFTVSASFSEWEYTVDTSGVTITKYHGNATTVEIPSEFDGKPVTAIGNEAFSFKGNITSIRIPDTVSSIGRAAFYNCQKLEQINLPESITRIAESVFYDCDSLKSIQIPSSVTSIDKNAFSGSRLTSITIPGSVANIGEGAFSSCRLASVKFEKSTHAVKVQAQAFFYCYPLTDLIIESSDFDCGSNAFADVYNVCLLSDIRILQNQDPSAHGITRLAVNKNEPGKVTVNVTPDTANGYMIDKVYYTPEGGSDTEISAVNGVYTFSTADITSGKVTVSATFKLKQYTITWKDGDGKTLKTESVNPGAVPSYSGDTPTKKPTAEYEFTFNNTWDPVPAAADKDETYTAQFSRKVRKYTITFVNEDGTKLQSSEVAYGETPSYTGNTPTKTEDADNIYTFKEWKPAIAAVTGEATYTAAFTANAKTEYTVIWQNGDGTELDKKTYKEGAAEPTTDKTPTKAEDEDNTYAFDKWDGGTVNGTVKTYKPVFTATAKDKPEPAKTEYTVIWLDGDGSELDKKTYKEGEAEPTTDKTPTKAEDEDNTYAFDKWDGGTVSGTTKTYKPSFTATAKDKPEPAKAEYTVIWLDGDGSELDRKTYKEGEAEPTTDKVPTKAADEDNVYTFSKWDGGSTEGNVKTYKPVFNATPKTQYTVIWLNGDGAELDRKTYKEGEAEPTTDKVPTKAADEDNVYTFSKWDGGSTEGNVKTYKPLFTAKAKPAPKPAEPNWWYAPENPPAAQPGLVTRVTVDKGIYQLYENTGTAMLVGITSEKIKELNIPATVSANGRTYKVTEIDGKVCQKLKKLKTVVFGKYVKIIGRKAFYQCAKLRTLIFRGKKLKAVGEKAFEGIHKKAEATVPGGKYSLYKRLLLDAGFPEKGEIGK